MTVPSIKGSAFQSVIDDLQALVAAGKLSRDALEARLGEVDLQLLDSKVAAGLWYPLESYARLTEVLLAVEGRGNPAYLVRRGARAAERLFAAGLYLQLQRGEEIGAEKRTRNEGWTAREGNLMASLAGAIFSVSRWRFEVDPGDPRVQRIHVSEAAGLPEVSRLAAQGFVEYTATRLTGAPVVVTSERPARDRIVFTLRPARA